ncbi:hypothetical protein QGM61_01560 [Pseudohongiella sp. SYSU M77423]|uniref:hypothetical protein n=1 Tax=Pseudohongiella sp. SYSU M77423 TaxID=3042312 RepID=UPI00248037AD|nr:hypothetical protein [Pseudohongiella sp. SYSU M77423]MDH7942494.1 hypothetical protein [Pseudohongiella sp. SYSU M77423]
MSSSISVKMRLLENYVFEIDFGEFGKEAPGELHATVTGTTERVDNYLRITSLAVTLKLGKAASEYQSLDKVLPVFENYCVVTQSVKRGIPVTVDIQDADGEKVVV